MVLQIFFNVLKYLSIFDLAILGLGTRDIAMMLNDESVPASLFCMDFLSAGQCAIGDGGAFVPPAAVAGDGSTSNAGRWIRDFYDTTGGRRRGGTSGTGGSNASAGMVHIK